MNQYRVGIVLSQAGLNAGQRAEALSRLSFVRSNLKAMKCESVLVTVPSMGIDPEILEAALAPFALLDSVDAVVSTGWDEPEGVVRALFLSYDEVWVFPAHGQTRRTVSRCWSVYKMAEQMPGQVRKYKLIPAWLPIPEPTGKADLKPKKALKGY